MHVRDYKPRSATCPFFFSSTFSLTSSGLPDNEPYNTRWNFLKFISSIGLAVLSVIAFVLDNLVSYNFVHSITSSESAILAVYHVAFPSCNKPVTLGGGNRSTTGLTIWQFCISRCEQQWPKCEQGHQIDEIVFTSQGRISHPNHRHSKWKWYTRVYYFCFGGFLAGCRQPELVVSTTSISFRGVLAGEIKIDILWHRECGRSRCHIGVWWMRRHIGKA